MPPPLDGLPDPTGKIVLRTEADLFFQPADISPDAGCFGSGRACSELQQLRPAGLLSDLLENPPNGCGLSRCDIHRTFDFTL
jgi:hypothetical protein